MNRETDNAKLRNQLSPFYNLVSMILKRDDRLGGYVIQEAEQCEKNKIEINRLLTSIEAVSDSDLKELKDWDEVEREWKKTENLGTYVFTFLKQNYHFPVQREPDGYEFYLHDGSLMYSCKTNEKKNIYESRLKAKKVDYTIKSVYASPINSVNEKEAVEFHRWTIEEGWEYDSHSGQIIFMRNQKKDIQAISELYQLFHNNKQ